MQMNLRIYEQTVDALQEAFGSRLKTVVIFGSQARGEADERSDHDLFLVIDGLPWAPLQRVRAVRAAIARVDLAINTIAKTPDEMAMDLTPLLLDVCVDGVCLFGSDFFDPYRKKALNALRQAGLQRRKVGREWSWHFPSVRNTEWALTWDGYHEFA